MATSGETPDYLYHYTDSGAFISILKNKVFWLSKLGYMNDSSEGNYCYSIAHDYLLKLSNSKSIEDFDTPDEYFAAASGYLEIAREISPQWAQNTYVLSFSANGDSLSQWRAYTPNGGFSIGFPMELLSEYCKKTKNAELNQCTYFTAEHETSIHEIVDRKLADLKFPLSEPKLSELAIEFRSELEYLSKIFKHSSFEDELEYRVTVSTKLVQENSTDLTPDMRFNGKYLIPYTTLLAEELFPKIADRPLKIYFSPGNYSAEGCQELRTWMLAIGLMAPEFHESVSPYST